jgi:methylthioribulose-1-phosphate dehydratase
LTGPGPTRYPSRVRTRVLRRSLTPSLRRRALGAAIAAIGRRFYTRGWVLGTSGNFSAVVSTAPLSLLITPSAAHKGTLDGRECLEIDGDGRVIRGGGRPSAETALHLTLVRTRGAAAVLHTHSVWATILSSQHLADGGFAIEGYEMLKGLAGVETHEHREWIPVVANDQDMSRLAPLVGRHLVGAPAAHAFLIAGHGLYTWGTSLEEAERHVEILEFLMEVVGRQLSADTSAVGRIRKS